MTDPKHVFTVVGEWIEKAESDLIMAVHALKLGKDCPTEGVCFHAQQVVEKYLKALMVLRGIDFPKIHSIEKLVLLLPPSDRPPLKENDQERLTFFATVSRYPWDGKNITLAEARHAVALARKVRREIRKKMPHSALPTKRKKT